MVLCFRILPICKKLFSISLTWCSRFCRGSCRFSCSTTCRFPRAGPGSRSTSGIGCASSCPWCRGGNGLRFYPRSLRSASRTGTPCPPLAAGCCLPDSPSSLKKNATNIKTCQSFIVLFLLWTWKLLHGGNVYKNNTEKIKYRSQGWEQIV